MYFKIMHAKLELPDNLDAETKDILPKVFVFFSIVLVININAINNFFF